MWVVMFMEQPEYGQRNRTFGPFDSEGEADEWAHQMQSRVDEQTVDTFVLRVREPLDPYNPSPWEVFE